MDRRAVCHLGGGLRLRRWSVSSFIAARFIGGLGIGISTVAAPLYISEIAPPAYRGRLAGMFQFNIVFGIVIAFLSNALLAGIGENAWRWMLGRRGVSVPPLHGPVLWHSRKPALADRAERRPRGGTEGAADSSSPTPPQAQIEAQADEILAALLRSASSPPISGPGKLRIPILLAFLIAFFNQLSGINAVLYFAPRIFELTGWARRPRCCNPSASG